MTIQDDLAGRFPQMQPIHSVPPLARHLGCGLGLCGARDHDVETGTYVKTYCLSVVWIPILALRAYRVAKDDERTYLLGREPLSGSAKLGNFVVLVVAACLAGSGYWNAHTNSPDYQAGKRLAEARQLADDGELVEAAELYRDVVTGRTGHADDAETALRDLVQGPVQQAPAEDAAAIFEIIVELQEQSGREPIVPGLFDEGLKLVENLSGSDPGGAALILDAVAPLAGDADALAARREDLLVRAVEQHPDDLVAASKLAVICEARGEIERCESLLAPHQDHLGSTEGARILGQIYARKGDVKTSFALLHPYAEQRLKKLHEAEEAYGTALEKAWTRMLEHLNEGEAPDSFYRRYEAASEVEREALVDEYAQKRIRDNREIQAKLEAVMQAAGVVPVALDLGIVRLRRAQEMTDAEDRRRELEEAEKTFLAIRGLAGESDEYRLFLGQVYYWLGRHDEGSQLFEELLAANDRSYDMLMRVADTLRDVGARSETRQLTEEAYNRETDEVKKSHAAMARALSPIDLKDRITWLRRADSANNEVKGALAMALGHEAIAEGNKKKAARHLRKAVAVYESAAESASTLNNGALACLGLFEATGDREAWNKGTELIERAMTLAPSDAVLVFNTASVVLEGALMDVAGGEIDFEVLSMRGDLAMLSHLYQDETGLAAVRKRVRAQPNVAKALTYYDKLLVLSPKNSDVYSALFRIHAHLRDAPALRELLGRLQEVEIDLDNERKQALEFYAGKDDAQHRKRIEGGIERFGRLVKATQSEPDSVTFAVAATHLADQRMFATLLGLPVDANAVVRLAEQAHAAAPSRATSATLVAALLLRAGERLANEDVAYAEMQSRARRSLPPSYLIAIALNRPGEVCDAAREDTDVQRAMSLLIESGDAFPSEHSSWEWAMLRAAHPEEATEIARTVSRDEVAAPRNDIALLLSPVTATTAFDVHWSMMIAGKEAEGRDILKRYADRGVPMPFDLEDDD